MTQHGIFLYSIEEEKIETESNYPNVFVFGMINVFFFMI